MHLHPIQTFRMSLSIAYYVRHWGLQACSYIALIGYMFIDGKKVCVRLDLLWSYTQSEKIFGDECKLQQQDYHRWCQAFCSEGQHNDGDPTGKRTLVRRNLSSNDQSPDHSFGPNAKSRPRLKSARTKSANFHPFYVKRADLSHQPPVTKKGGN